jgi:hypothetical protein
MICKEMRNVQPSCLIGKKNPWPHLRLRALMLSLVSPFEEPTAPENLKNFHSMVAAT